MMIGVLLPQRRSEIRGCRRCAGDRRDARAPSPERDPEGCGAMIGKLKGMIDCYGEDFVILDVSGVGYVVHCSARTLQALPAPGEPAVLAIETYVREDQIRLFGFLSDVEREWFRLLQTVQGVGAKVALSVLGTLKPADLATAVAMRDKATIARTPGVGPKVAERIVTELKDKAPAYADVDPAVIRLAGAVDEKRAPQPVADAVSALVNLGYGQPQAAAAIAAAAREAGEGADAAQLIRLGLRELSEVTSRTRDSRSGRSSRPRRYRDALRCGCAGAARRCASAARQDRPSEDVEALAAYREAAWPASPTWRLGGRCSALDHGQRRHRSSAASACAARRHDDAGREKGSGLLRVIVTDDISVLGFYQRRGFRIIGVSPADDTIRTLSVDIPTMGGPHPDARRDRAGDRAAIGDDADEHDTPRRLVTRRAPRRRRRGSLAAAAAAGRVHRPGSRRAPI